MLNKFAFLTLAWLLTVAPSVVHAAPDPGCAGGVIQDLSQKIVVSGIRDPYSLKGQCFIIPVSSISKETPLWINENEVIVAIHLGNDVLPVHLYRSKHPDLSQDFVVRGDNIYKALSFKTGIATMPSLEVLGYASQIYR